VTADVCPVCEGSGLVPGPARCPDTCTPLTHAPGCPTRPPTRCPFCVADELGEDLGG
jgi:hypothetical protein